MNSFLDDGKIEPGRVDGVEIPGNKGGGKQRGNVKGKQRENEPR